MNLLLNAKKFRARGLTDKETDLKLVERQKELDLLLELLGAVRNGRGQIVLLTGEAGIGKSSLLSALHQKVANEKHAIRSLSGGCEALFTPRTLGPIFDMSAGLNVDIEKALQSERGLTTLYADVLAALDGPQPTIMICEDLHWADRATLDLIKFLARRISLLPVLLILTIRDNEVGLSHPLTQVLGDLPGQITHRIALQPLSPRAVVQLAAKTGQDGKAVHAITNGNPFFVSEMLNAQSAPNAIPASVKDAVALRLSHLSAEERNVLERISVIPNVARYEFLEALLGPDTLNLVSGYIDRGFLVEDGIGVRFRHELSRRATLERIIPARRRTFHSACLRVLMGQAGQTPIDQIVHHASGANDSQTVLEYAPKAAEAAISAGSHREAAAHYQTALRFVDAAEPEQAAHLYESWAYEAVLSDQMDDEVLKARRHAITLWRALNRPDKVGHNLRHLSRLHWYRGESAEAARLADQAIRVLETLPASSEVAMAYSLRAQYHMLNDQMTEAIKWGEMALSLEADYPSPEIRMHALNNIGTARVFRNDRSGIKALDESLSLAITHGHHEAAARAYNNLAEFGVEFRDFALAEKTIEAGLAFDTEHDLDAWTHYLSGRLAQLRVDQGRFEDARAIAQGIVSKEELPLVSRLPAKLVLAKVSMRLGLEGFETLMEEALSDALATDELQYSVPARFTYLEWAWLTDAAGRAAEHMEKLNQLGVNDRHPWNIGARAIWADRLGQGRASLGRAEIPEPYKLELAGHYLEAASAWTSLGLPYEAALVRSRQQTAEAITTSLQQLSALNARLASEKLSRDARHLGLAIELPDMKRGPYRAARSHPMGLTAKEQIVLRYLKDGLSNKDIAERLNRSQRTIEHHVASILNKLSAPNRMAAILRVQREPWLINQDEED